MLVGLTKILAVVAVVTVTACAGPDRQLAMERSVDVPPTTVEPADTTVASTTVPPTTAAPPEHIDTVTAAAAPDEAVAPPAVPRIVVATGFSPFATAGTVTLLHPADEVERLGFHEAGHDGARQMEVAPTATRPITLESRNRGTDSRTAVDIVVAPGTEIRAPVTGTVLRAGGYTLYCDHTDHFAVIEPDGLPGWEVKVLHIDGLHVAAGQRVDAGITVMASGPTVLPFESQVDEFTGEPSWPHVHVEVVDTSIPDRPPPGGSSGGCN